MLKKNGSSKALKRRILKRHFIYLILYYLMIIDNYINQVIVGFDNFFLQSIGLLLAISRIVFDPYVLNTLKSDLSQLKTKNKSIHTIDRALCSFVNSAMNIEYVYLILVAME